MASALLVEQVLSALVIIATIDYDVVDEAEVVRLNEWLHLYRRYRSVSMITLNLSILEFNVYFNQVMLATQLWLPVELTEVFGTPVSWNLNLQAMNLRLR